MQCPTCQTTLEARDLSSQGFVKIDHCPSCRGCWLDVAALHDALPGVWSDVEEIEVTSAEVFSDMLCPHCAARLLTVNPEDHGDLSVERCSSCHGIWLDSGELRRLRNVLIEEAEHQGKLTERPPGWSKLKWVSYRVAERWEDMRYGAIV